MASEEAQAGGEGAALLSQEQRVKRARAEEGTVVSKVKLYSLASHRRIANGAAAVESGQHFSVFKQSYLCEPVILYIAPSETA